MRVPHPRGSRSRGTCPGNLDAAILYPSVAVAAGSTACIAPQRGPSDYPGQIECWLPFLGDRSGAVIRGLESSRSRGSVSGRSECFGSGLAAQCGAAPFRRSLPFYQLLYVRISWDSRRKAEKFDNWLFRQLLLPNYKSSNK